MTRVQVLLDEDELARFRRQAQREGLSLSAWLRQAGQERLQSRRGRRIQTVDDLREFFRAVDERESGSEPDWEEQKVKIARSRAAGQSGT